MEYEREESMGYIIPEQALLQVGQTLLKAGVQGDEWCDERLRRG
jgi:hypothetical protein